MRASSIKSQPRLVLPSVRKGHGWRPDTPSAKDKKLSERLGPVPAAAGSPAYLDPATYPKIRDQGQQGSCTGHGVRTALMQRLVARDRALWSRYDLSPAYAYLQGRIKENSVEYDTGCEIRDVIWAAAKYGVAREDYCPYDEYRLLQRASEAANTSARWHQAIRYYRCDEAGTSREQTVTNIARALAAGMPVVFGFSCFDNLSEANYNGVIPLPTSRSQLEGGHCVVAFEFDGDSLIGPNSWGDWGGVGRDGQCGYFRLPIEYFLYGYADDAWAVDHE